MRRQLPFLQLLGLGCMVAGVATAGLPSLAAAPRAAPAPPSPPVLIAAHPLTVVAAPSVRIRINAGPSLVGRPTQITLLLSATGRLAPGVVDVTDAIPAGMTFVAGSTRLSVNGGKASRPAPHSEKAATTLLSWLSVRVPAANQFSSLAFSVAPVPPGAAAGLAGSSWTDRAAVYAAPSGPAAPSAVTLTESRLLAADIAATSAQSIRVGLVAAVEAGRLLAPASPRAAQKLEETLTVTGAPGAATHNVVVKVYLPGAVTWGGCRKPALCTPPTRQHLSLPVTAGQPDLPQLSPPAPHVAVTPASKRTPAWFTVLTWRLGTLAAGAHGSITYRVDAGRIARVRSSDLVTASGTSAPPASSKAVPALVRLPTGLLKAGSQPRAGTAAITTTTVQSWPVDGLASKAGSTSAAVAVNEVTTTTTVASAGRDPFSPTGPTTTTTTKSAATTTTTPSGKTTTTTKKGTSTTTSAKGKLATTGFDLARTTEGGVILAGAGVLLMLAGRRRRPGVATADSDSDSER